MIIVFMPMSIPKASFYIDYPFLLGSKLLFIRTKQDIQKLNGRSNQCKVVLYAVMPTRELLEVIKMIKYQHKMEVFNYEAMEDDCSYCTSDYSSFKTHQLVTAGAENRQSDRDRYYSI